MFACLYVPPSAATRGASAPAGEAPDAGALLDVARTVSPRVAARSGRQIVIDVEGLERLVGDARTIGERLRQAGGGSRHRAGARGGGGRRARRPCCSPRRARE